MARILCNVAGGGKPLKGNAEPGDVLAGKTFSNKQSNALTGSMPNNGAWSASTSGNGSVTIPAGYHNGNGTVSGAASYNSGYTNGKNDTGFNLAANVTIYSWGGTSVYPGTGDRSYTFTATQTTWWAADGYIGRSDKTSSISGQGSGVLWAGQSHTITAHTSTTEAHDCAIIHFAAWVKA